jgi:PPOX class probable FMN-dependent enzyme
VICDREEPMASDFDELIATRERLRSLYKQPSDRAHNKVIDHIDDVCRRFIAASPFVIVASRGADGRLDVSPKGDPPGFVDVLDERTLAIPDRLGNNRLDTFDNLLVHPEVGLLFLIPGNGDTLRVSGTARLVRDATLQARLAVDGRTPNLVVVVTVEEAFMHCPKCIARSKLWSPDHWPDRTNVPSLAEALVAHAAPSQTVAEVQAAIDDHNARLY